MKNKKIKNEIIDINIESLNDKELSKISKKLGFNFKKGLERNQLLLKLKNTIIERNNRFDNILNYQYIKSNFSFNRQISIYNNNNNSNNNNNNISNCQEMVCGFEILFWKVFRSIVINRNLMSNLKRIKTNQYNEKKWELLYSVKLLLENDEISILKYKVKLGEYLDLKESDWFNTFSKIKYDSQFYQNLIKNYQNFILEPNYLIKNLHRAIEIGCIGLIEAILSPSQISNDNINILNKFQINIVELINHSIKYNQCDILKLFLSDIQIQFNKSLNYIDIFEIWSENKEVNIKQLGILNYFILDINSLQLEYSKKQLIKRLLLKYPNLTINNFQDFFIIFLNNLSINELTIVDLIEICKFIYIFNIELKDDSSNQLTLFELRLYYLNFTKFQLNSPILDENIYFNFKGKELIKNMFSLIESVKDFKSENSINLFSNEYYYIFYYQHNLELFFLERFKMFTIQDNQLLFGKRMFEYGSLELIDHCFKNQNDSNHNEDRLNVECDSWIKGGNQKFIYNLKFLSTLFINCLNETNKQLKFFEKLIKYLKEYQNSNQMKLFCPVELIGLLFRFDNIDIIKSNFQDLYQLNNDSNFSLYETFQYIKSENTLIFLYNFEQNIFLVSRNQDNRLFKFSNPNLNKLYLQIYQCGCFIRPIDSDECYLDKFGYSSKYINYEYNKQDIMSLKFLDLIDSNYTNYIEQVIIRSHSKLLSYFIENAVTSFKSNIVYFILQLIIKNASFNVLNDILKMYPNLLSPKYDINQTSEINGLFTQFELLNLILISIKFDTLKITELLLKHIQFPKNLLKTDLYLNYSNSISYNYLLNNLFDQ